MDARLQKKDEQEFLKNYKPGDYERPSVTSDILVFTTDENRLQILLIKREGYPYRNCWAIPGGFVGMEESTLEAAKRELKEEAGIENVHLEQLYTFSEPDRDPRMRIISVAYMATVPKYKIKNHFSGDDANSSEIFDIFLDNGKLQLVGESDGLIVTGNELAFDHEEIIKMAIERLKGKMNYSTIAFNFLENQRAFTLRELYKIFNAVNGKEEDFSNFRKKIINTFSIEKNFITEIDVTENADGKGRPSKIWKCHIS